MIIKFPNCSLRVFEFERTLKEKNISYEYVSTVCNGDEYSYHYIVNTDISDILSKFNGSYDAVDEIIGNPISQDEEVVYIPLKTEKHMEAHSDVEWNHVKQAIAKIDLNGNDFFMETVDLGYTIGKSSLVSSEGRPIKMLYRKGRAGKSPIIVNGLKTPTTKITIGICKDEYGDYCLFTAFYGEKAEKEPWDNNIKTNAEREASEKFWATHAIICTADEIDWERSKS